MIDEPEFDSAPAEEGMDDGGMGNSDEGSQSQGMATINRDVCPDCKPGDTLTFKVERVHNDEVELSLQDEGGEGARAEAPESMTEREPAQAPGGDY